MYRNRFIFNCMHMVKVAAYNGKCVLNQESIFSPYKKNKKQIRQLERMVSSYFDYIEDLVERENVFTMQEFSDSINAFLEFRKYDILKDNRKISHQQALEKAYGEYDIYNKHQPIESDFDRIIEHTAEQQ